MMNGQYAELVTDDLPPPYIRESPTSALLNPVAVRYSCRIVMEYAIEPTDKVSVTWAGAPGAGSYTSGFFPVGELRPLEVGIGGTPLVIFNQGKTVTLRYSVIRGTSAPVTSQPLILYVLPLSQSDLPRPFIPQATDFGEGLVLDVNALTEYTLRINAWPLLTRGQYFWLRLRGLNANDSVFNELYWSAPSNVVDQEFNRGFYARNYSANPLKGLKDRSTLTLEFMAGLEGSQDVALAQRFAHRNYIVRTNAPITPERPVIFSVKDPLSQDIADGGSTVHSSVTVHGSAMADEEVEVFDGEISRGTDSADSNGRWELPATELANGSHVFTAKALYGSGEVSNKWTIDIASLLLQPPSIKEAPDNTNLNPIAARDRLTAVVDYVMEPEDIILVTWTGTPGAGSQTTPPVAAGSTRPREIPLPISLVRFNLGKPVTVTFTYTRGTSTPQTSLPRTLNVLTIPADELIAPVITQANGTPVLDLKDVLNGGTLRFGRWPHIAVAQRIWLNLEGQNAEGNSHNLTIWTGGRNAVTRGWVSTGSFDAHVLYDYLKELGDGSKLSILFRVNMDGLANLATAVNFPARIYTVVGKKSGLL
jgi:hypothetical protein